MITTPYTQEAEELLMRGNNALSKASWNGMLVDVPYCIAQQKELHESMRRIEADAWKQEPYWKKKFGSGATLGNDNQVREVLFSYLKITPPVGREDGDEDGMEKADKDAMNQIDHPLAGLVLEYRKARKTADTFLQNLIEESVDGVIHPWFHLHRAKTYRSSSSGPNFQNFPMRDPVQSKIIRNAFPAGGEEWVIIEIDYSGVEVRVATCYHKDPTMVKYIIEDYDMHRDMALECYMLTAEQYAGALPKPKTVRHASKNSFVFPAFYGSYFAQIAPNLWKAMLSGDMRLADGTPFAQHLATKGIKCLGEMPRDPRTGKATGSAPKGTFLHHIATVEANFWNKRFPVYTEWKKWWYAQYQKKGWFQSKTGFHHEGLYRKNDVINHPIQGDAFHCNLRSFYRLTDEMEKRNMESYLCGQIHDSIIARVKVSEMQDYLALAAHITQAELMQAWPWLIVPIKVEAEACPPDGTWYGKKEIKLPEVN